MSVANKFNICQSYPGNGGGTILVALLVCFCFKKKETPPIVDNKIMLELKKKKT